MNNQRAAVLILGVGNILLSDEGVGVRTVQRLEQDFEIPAGVEILDGGTSGMELISHIENREYLLIVDAVKDKDLPAGSAVRIVLHDPPAYFQQKITPHQLGLSDVLAAAVLTDCLPQNILLYGVIPQSLNTGLDLSDEVLSGMNEIIDRIQADLKEMGYVLHRKQDSTKARAQWIMLQN